MSIDIALVLPNMVIAKIQKTPLLMQGRLA